MLMVHASLRRLGPVAGGASGVVAALDEAVGPSGTLLMMAGADDPWGWVNERPEHERAALLADAAPFDALLDPVDADVGVLAEVFRTTPGTVVSDHPEGRFAARGAHAEDLVAAPPWDHYYGPRSALERLVQLRGSVLRLGSDLDTVTLLHYAEYLADVPHKRTVTRHRTVLRAEGAVVRTITCLDDSNGIVPRPPGAEDYFATITRAAIDELQATGAARRGTVGAATSELLDAAALVEFATAWMTAHLA
jgi:aminoglycoside N3'-acetyltransferase